MRRIAQTSGLIVLAALMICFVVACRNETGLKITDISNYKNLSDSPAKIVVEFEDAYVGTFEIADNETLNEVIDLLFNKTTFKKVKKELGAGGNSKMTLVYSDGTEVAINLQQIVDGNKAYQFETAVLLQRIQEIGLERGELLPH